MSQKLHALIPVATGAQEVASKAMADTGKHLDKHRSAYSGNFKTLRPKSAEAGAEIKPVVEAENKVEITVGEQMAYIAKFVGKAIDLEVSREETNASGHAKADLVLDGKKIAELSVLSLMRLEHYLVRLRSDIAENIPTRDANREWLPDGSKDGLFRTSPLTTEKTERVKKAIVLYQATEHHPAQAQLIDELTVTGYYETVNFSGAWSIQEKVDFRERLDIVIEAVKQAKSRANEAQVVETKVADKLFGYLLKGALS